MNAEYEIAADFCLDHQMDAAALVLRDERCNPGSELIGIAAYRDAEHFEALTAAENLLDAFPLARAKLFAYVAVLSRFRFEGRVFDVAAYGICRGHSISVGINWWKPDEDVQNALKTLNQVAKAAAKPKFTVPRIPKPYPENTRKHRRKR